MRMQNTISTKVVVILDCCYSGSTKISKGSEDDAAKIGRLDEYAKEDKYVVISNYRNQILSCLQNSKFHLIVPTLINMLMMIQTICKKLAEPIILKQLLHAEISEIKDGIYRISGFVGDEISYNQFLIDDDQPTLIHTGLFGRYDKIEEKVKEVIPLEKLTYVAFLHFESDEWGGMEFLKAPKAKLLCSDLSSKLNLTGCYNDPADHISFWDNETLKTGKRILKFVMTPHVHHWDSMMIFETMTKSLFPSDLFIQPGNLANKPVVSDDQMNKCLRFIELTECLPVSNL